MRQTVLSILVALAVIVASGCLQDDDDDETTSPTTPTDTTTPTNGTQNDTAQQLSVRAEESGSLDPQKPWRFNPATLTATANKTVNITLTSAPTNSPLTEHNLVIDEFNLTIATVMRGESASGSFVPTTTGTFIYYCSIESAFGSHRELGLEGEITIEA